MLHSVKELVYSPHPVVKTVVFYASLVNTVMRWPIFGVLSAEHVATAIHFGNVGGNKEQKVFIHNKKHYVLAIPTYLRAGLG